MRRHLLAFGGGLAAICLAVLLTTGSASALSTGNGGWQWQNPLPQGHAYTGGYFLDARHGWLISAGDIFYTSDGGLTLTAQARHNVTFTAITFVGARHGWAVGYPAAAHGTGIVYRTVNGGKTWTRLHMSWRGGIKDVSFATSEIGWATSRHAVLHTTDGGVHWSAHEMAASDRPSGVQALGMRRAWVTTGGTTLLRTIDGGATWKRVRAGAATDVNLVRFTSMLCGWAAGGGGEIVHTTDGGLHWSVQLACPSVSGLSFANSRDGWATAGGTVYRTTDGGADWTAQTTAPYATWVLATKPPGAIVGTSREGTTSLGNLFCDGLSRTTDGGASWQPSTRAADDYFGALKALQFVDAASGWAVGAGGEILHTANGGTSWAAQASNTTEGLNGVHFITATEGWAVGDQGTIMHTTDGGLTWTPQTSGVSDNLTGVTFTDAQRGWAVGETIDQYDVSTGVILTTSDGGQHWTTQTTPVPDAALSDVAFSDSRHGYAVGEIWGDSSSNATVILGTSDGGATWMKELTYTPPMTGNSSDGELRAIACGDAAHAVAVGYDDSYAEIFRTTNGGQTWIRSGQHLWPQFFRPTLTDVVFVDATHGWAVGDGMVIKTADGGVTWTKQAVAAGLGSGALDALSFVSPTRGCVAGQAAAILTTTTGGDAR